jgi:hypothetical protein
MLFRTVALTIVFATVGLLAQEQAPSGFLHGGLVAWTGTARNGEFTFQTTQGQAYLCSYDAKTYIERDNQRIAMDATEKGDRLEIVTDRRLDSKLCYARLMHVIDPPPKYIVPGVRPRPRPRTLNTAWLFRPHPNLTFSGAVFRVAPGVLELRSRSGEHQTLRLRPDTTYLYQGQTAELRSLQVNTVVFVEAARDLYGQLEAYQVIWGDILQPDQ